MKAMETKKYSKMRTELAELLYEQRAHGNRVAIRFDVIPKSYAWVDKDGNRTELGRGGWLVCLDDVEEVLSKFNLEG